MRGGRRAPGSPCGARGRNVWRRHAAPRSPAGRGTGRAGFRGAGVPVSSSSRGPSCVTRAPRPTVGLPLRDHPSAGHRRVRVRHAAILRHRDGSLHCDGGFHLEGGLDRESGVSAGRVCRGGDPPAARRPWPAGPARLTRPRVRPREPSVGPADGGRPCVAGWGVVSCAPPTARLAARPGPPLHSRFTAAPDRAL